MRASAGCVLGDRERLLLFDSGEAARVEANRQCPFRVRVLGSSKSAEEGPRQGFPLILEPHEGALAERDGIMNPPSEASSSVQARLVRNPTEWARNHVYIDLHNMGFHLSDGFQYGADFLAYTDVPARVHSKYAVRVWARRCPEAGGHQGASAVMSELTAFARVSRNSGKIGVIAVVEWALNDDADTPLSLAALRYFRCDNGSRISLDLTLPPLLAKVKPEVSCTDAIQAHEDEYDDVPGIAILGDTDDEDEEDDVEEG